MLIRRKREFKVSGLKFQVGEAAGSAEVFGREVLIEPGVVFGGKRWFGWLRVVGGLVEAAVGVALLGEVLEIEPHILIIGAEGDADGGQGLLISDAIKLALEW
jgi:hypothetical protein